MKEAIRFTLSYSGVSFLILILMQLFFRLLTTEIFSYAIWLYLFYSIIGFVFFILFGLLAKKYLFSRVGRLVLYAVLCLVVLNSIPFVEEDRILTFDLLKNSWNKPVDSINLGIHCIAIASFIVASLIIRKPKFSNDQGQAVF